MARKKTSVKVAKKASSLLRSKTTKKTKSVAASALSQREKESKSKKK